MIESVVFHKKLYTPEKANEWLSNHGLKSTFGGSTENYHHYQQKKHSGDVLRTIPVYPGIKFIIPIKQKLIKAGFSLGLPANIQSVLDQQGNKLITRGWCMRRPIPSTLEHIANTLTLGQFNQIKHKLGYDNYYHLWLQLTLDDNTPIILEKNQVVNIQVGDKGEPQNLMEVPKLFNSNITLSDFFTNSVNKFGTDYIFDYDMVDKNCQKFVTSLLVANGVDNPKLRKFVNQNVSEAITSDFIKTSAKVGIKIATAFGMILGFAKDKVNKLFNIG